MYFSIPHLPELPRGFRARKQASPLCKENAFPTAAPSPFHSHHLSSFFPTLCVGRKALNSLARFPSKWEGSLFLGMQRVKAIAGPSSGPREGGSFTTSVRLPASLGHSPFFPCLTPPPPLCTLCAPFKCQSGSIWAQPGSGSLTTARGPRPRQWHWETRAGRERASLCRPPSLRGQGVLGDRVGLAGSCIVPGASSDVASGTQTPLSAAAARGTVGWGFGGCRPQRPAPGGGVGATGSRG